MLCDILSHDGQSLKCCNELAGAISIGKQSEWCHKHIFSLAITSDEGGRRHSAATRLRGVNLDILQ